MAKISPKDIAEAVYGASVGKSGPELVSALKRSVQVLNGAHLLYKSVQVLGELQNIFDKKTGTVRMKVASAKSLSHQERHKLESEIKEKYQAQAVLGEYFEKEELLGGMKVEVGDEILDSTYINKLQQLEKFLMRAS